VVSPASTDKTPIAQHQTVTAQHTVATGDLHYPWNHISKSTFHTLAFNNTSKLSVTYPNC